MLHSIFSPRLVSLAACALGLGTAAMRAATLEVSMENTQFVPGSLTIQTGDTVRWTQRDLVGHSTTSGNVPVANGIWGSPVMSLNQTFSFTFTAPGNYPYFCVPHSFAMTGSITVQTPVNNPPTVQVTSPTDGASMGPPAHVTIDASAADPGGAVDSVEFRDGTSVLGVAFASPYRVVKTLSPGAHNLTAVATDNLGLKATSAVVRVTVTAPPDVVCGAALNGGGSVELGWTGGVGPFAVQEKASFGEALWRNRTFTEQRMAGVSPSGSRFYRVADTSVEPPVPFTMHMSGMLERPTPVVTGGSGSGTFMLEGNTLTFDIQYGGLSGPATAAHIHGPAPASLPAGVLINLAPYNGGGFGVSGTLSGSITLTLAQKAMVLAGLTYVNVHTGMHTGGEIRGQIAPVMMRVELNGANERPDPVDTEGRGEGGLVLVGNQLTFDLEYSGLSGTATAAHIHGPADETVPAGVLVNLAPFNGGAFGAAGTLSGTVTLTDAQLAHVVEGLTYVNIHTPDHNPGEIRGQILPQSTAVPMTAHMNGAMERPTPVTTAGTGSGVFGLEGDLLRFQVRYANLTGTATAAHIHGPAPASGPAGVLINLAPYNGGGFGSSGILAGAITLTASQKAMILSGLTYVNVHTVMHTGGEIRGQIVPVLMRCELDGSKEQPNPLAVSGSGSGHLLLVRDRLWMNVTYRGLTATATASHIHGPQTVFDSAGVLVNLAALNGGGYGASGALFGALTLSAQNLAHVMDGMTYINFHTPGNSDGEIRGQIVRP